MRVTAIHEAGHAWAYHRHDKPLRYITIRPIGQGVAGICRPWKPRRMNAGVAAFIASAGPIAEALHLRATDADHFEWEDLLTAAVLTGGHDDYEASLGYLDSADVVGLIRSEIESEWSAIEDLADRLMSVGTVSGREAFEVLSRG